METDSISNAEYEVLLQQIRMVVPKWLRLRHSTHSIAGQAATELLADSPACEKFIHALRESNSSELAKVWLPIVQRIRNRYSKQASRSKVVPLEVDLPNQDEKLLESCVSELLDDIECKLANDHEGRDVFREIFVPYFHTHENSSLSVATIQRFLQGTQTTSSRVWAEQTYARVIRAILAACKTDEA